MKIEVKFDCKDNFFKCQCDRRTHRCPVAQVCEEFDNLTYSIEYKTFKTTHITRQFLTSREHESDASKILLMYGLCEHCQNQR